MPLAEAGARPALKLAAMAMRARHRNIAAATGLALAVGAASLAWAQGARIDAASRPAEASAKPPARSLANNAVPASAADELHPIPAAVSTTLRSSGVALKHFGVHVRAVDASAPTMSLNGEEPFLLASTTKVVTSLAALNLLGPTQLWRTQAHSSTPVRNGRLAGDLVIVGGTMGLTPDALRRWFKQMRGEGLQQVSGRIVLERFSLLHETQPAQSAQPAPAAAAALAARTVPDALNYNSGASVVVVQATKGELASIRLQPAIPGVVIVNEMLMGGASTAVCGARVRWGELQDTGRGGLPPLLVSGRWVADCGRQEVAFVKLPTGVGTALAVGTSRNAAPAPAATFVPGSARKPELKADATQPSPQGSLSVPDRVAALWAEAGGQLRGGVIEAASPTRAPRAWASHYLSSMPEVLRELNKTSNNDAARDLLLSLASPGPPAAARLNEAQGRVGAWMRDQGLADGDIVIDDGSGQSRLERGRPRAMVQLLLNQWRAQDARMFVDSLPIAGVDGTLANRLRKGPAGGRAFMKTGTLSDTRALAGYVMGASGKVYAVALMVNHAQAARATPALDALVEWLARNG